ncbi:hypothetical protein [Oryza sativa Japonica Group]|uniref:Uncharacterized protein n=1 Tax=Oryza sativa subsp. japonica TaxID=39947 RepID=Q5VPB3_ORYSJ|nr:uncharacterized protein LOC107281468 [Oryza sativa Japonica Group]BAD68689.1 hypothetical protein [Oryza sativa Japonica Group]BAD68713.1 hypothetical protein [Oryza sativa Japonica Group]
MEMAVSGITAQLSTGLAILSVGAAHDKGKELTVIDVDVNVGGGRVRSNWWEKSRAARSGNPGRYFSASARHPTAVSHRAYASLAPLTGPTRSPARAMTRARPRQPSGTRKRRSRRARTPSPPAAVAAPPSRLAPAQPAEK